MKRFFPFLLKTLTLVLLLASPAMGTANPWDVKLPFKQATIKYTVSGSENGSEILYIRDYGKETARHRRTTAKIMFMTTSNDIIEITTPDWIYQIDLNEKSGTKSVNPAKYMIEEYNRLSKNDRKKILKNAEKTGKAAMKGIQGKIEKKAAVILGYPCDKVTAMGSTTYMISDSGIILKSETNMAGMNFKTVATDISKGSVPDNVFSVPRGITITHDTQADQMAGSMASQTIAWLLDPENNQQPGMNISSAPAREYDSETPPASTDENNQDMDDAMKKGMDALRGLFGN